jgi:excisionase family DNA binding protein
MMAIKPDRPNAPKLYTIQQIAECVGASTRTVRRWIAKGLLVSHRINGLVRVSEADFLAFWRPIAANDHVRPCQSKSRDVNVLPISGELYKDQSPICAKGELPNFRLWPLLAANDARSKRLDRAPRSDCHHASTNRIFAADHARPGFDH